MIKIIDGKKLAEKIKDETVREIIRLNGRRPNLAIILIGERADSKLYVGLKEKEAKKIGIDVHLYKCGENISEGELLKAIKCLNEDELIDAILIQLPLPASLDADTVVMSVDPLKDVDGFHPDNLEKLLEGCDFNPPYPPLEGGAKALMPPVFAAALAALASVNYQVKGKEICIISNSDIFGKTLAHIFNCQGARAEATGADVENLENKTAQADVLITAVGRPEFIKKQMIKSGAVIIDIGISKRHGRVVGDADFRDLRDKAGYITPVPGGIGPLTIAMAFKNTLELHKRRRKI